MRSSVSSGRSRTSRTLRYAAKTWSSGTATILVSSPAPSPMGYGAAVGGADLGRIFLQYPRQRALGRLRRAALEFGLRHLERQRAGGRVDADAIAVLHQTERPAGGGLRRDVADHHPARGARVAAVGQERHLLTHPLAVNKGGDAEHLAHARPALRAFVADHEHLSRLIGAAFDDIGARLLGIEHARPALERERLESGDLDERAFRREVPLQYDDAARLHDRLAPHHFAVGAGMGAQRCFERLTRKGEAIPMEGTVRQQRFENSVDAADSVEILGEEAAAGLEIGDERRALRDAREIVEREADAGLMRDRRNV